MHDGCAEEPGFGRVFYIRRYLSHAGAGTWGGAVLSKGLEGVSLVAFVCQRRIASAGMKRQSAVQSHAFGFLVALFSQLFTVLPDGEGRAGHDERSQQKDLRCTKAVEATFREPLDKGIGADRTIHRAITVTSLSQCTRSLSEGYFQHLLRSATSV